MRELQAVIGREAREQLLDAEGRLPEAVVACVGGGSNAIGIFSGFVDDRRAAGRRRGRRRGEPRHGPPGGPARRALVGARRRGRPDADAHSISAGLDYPGVGPEHAHLRDTGRAEYVGATDEEALAAFHRLAGPRGSSPRSSRRTRSRARSTSTRSSSLVCLSGRGDKDLAQLDGDVTYEAERIAAFFDAYGEQEWTRFEDGRTPSTSLEVHREYLRRFVRAGDRVLDIGAGPGRFTLELARLGRRRRRRGPLSGPA